LGDVVNLWRTDEVLGATHDGRFRRIVVQESRLRCGTLSFAPGDYVEEHAHLTSDEIFYGVSGTGRITVEGESLDVGPGDLVFIPAGERHIVEVSELAAEPFVIFAAVAPNTGDDTLYSSAPQA
jgi:quercetin dioxygenase-like cupin family protein